jgi:TonB family protein
MFPPLLRLSLTGALALALNPVYAQTAAEAAPAASAPTPAPAPLGSPAKVKKGASVVLDGCARPAYPRAALRQERTGTVTMDFTISVEGAVKEARIRESSGHQDLDQAALESLSKCKFVPATVDGVPVETSSPVKYVWVLKDKKKIEQAAELLLHTCATPAPQPTDGIPRVAVLESLIDASGRITATRVLKSSGSQLVDRAAIASQQSCRALPSLRAGKPSETWVPVTYFWDGEASTGAAHLPDTAATPAPMGTPYFDISHCGPVARPSSGNHTRAAFVVRFNHQGRPEQLQTVASQDVAPDLHRAAEPAFIACTGRPSSSSQPVEQHRMAVRYFWPRKDAE